NMMAKWYQMAITACPPRLRAKMLAMPTANAGAPPVRFSMVFSPTAAARALMSAAETGNPQPEIVVAAAAALSPTIPAGLLMAKYKPGCSTHAAMIAMMATNDSAIMAP